MFDSHISLLRNTHESIAHTVPTYTLSSQTCYSYKSNPTHTHTHKSQVIDQVPCHTMKKIITRNTKTSFLLNDTFSIDLIQGYITSKYIKKIAEHFFRMLNHSTIFLITFSTTTDGSISFYFFFFRLTSSSESISSKGHHSQLNFRLS